MSKKNKSKKNQSEKKKINLKAVLIASAVVLAVLICGAVVFGIVKGAGAVKEKVLDVAFYDLPENVITPLKEKISAEYEEKINFVELSEDQFNAEQISKNYDFFISWNGAAVEKLSDSAKKISQSCYSLIIQTEIPENEKYLPLALDHWEVAYYKTAMDAIDTGYPRSLDELEALLTRMKEVVFIPLYCSGGYDDNLFAFISAVTEALGGNKAYTKLVSLISNANSLEAILDEELDEASKITLRTVLNKIKSWQESEILYSKWMNAKDSDLINVGNQRQLGAFFTSLTNHRQLPLSVVEVFSADRFPLVNNNDKHGLIANSVVCMKFASSNEFDSIIASLVDNSYQYKLSKASKLAPVSSTSQAYDRNADDVRYLAAVSEYGAVPDLAKAAFQTNSQKKADLAASIRIYLKKNM